MESPREERIGMFELVKRIFAGRHHGALSATSHRPALTTAAAAKDGAAAVVDDLGATILYRGPIADDERPLVRHERALPSGEAICLIVLAGGRNRYHFNVPPEGAFIGRSTDCGLMVADPRVSSKHAWVGTVDGLPVIRDLGSTNGTFLNAGHHSLNDITPLEIGDTILLGGHYGVQLRVARADAAAAAESRSTSGG
jgi:hypothetical protein